MTADTTDTTDTADATDTADTADDTDYADTCCYSTDNIKCSNIQKQPWGLLTEITLPGDSNLGVYQARHKRLKPMAVKKKTKKASR